MMTNSAVSSVLAGACLSFCSPANAQSIDQVWMDPQPWSSQKSSALTIKLIVPLGAERLDKRSTYQPRLSFGYDYSLNPTEYAKHRNRLAIGMTLDGQFGLETGTTFLSQTDFSLAMNAEDAESEESGGSVTPWIVGGVVVVGLLAVAVNETADEISDTTRCVTDALFGGEGCE